MRRGAIAIGGLALTVLAAWSLGRDREEAGRWARVERRDLVFTVDVEGALAAIDSADLGPPQLADVWDFKISFLAPEGSEVVAGQPVLGFDTSNLARELQTKSAERESAGKELEKRATDLEVLRRDRELELAEAQARLRRQALKLAVPAEVSSRHELEAARIDHALAEAEIRNLEASLAHLVRQTAAELAALREKQAQAARRVEEMQAAIAAMTVTAPRAGTVSYKADWNGEKKKVGDSVWRAAKVLEIPDLTRMRARGEVDESDLGRIAVGQPVVFELDAHRELEIHGTVRRIARSVGIRSRRDLRKVAQVEIELASTDRERMRPGMRFRGRIETGRLEERLTVPLAAVVATAGGPTVTAGGLFGVRSLSPQLGRRDAERVEVTGGLVEGERVRLEGSR